MPRLFFALWPDADIRNSIASAAGKLQQHHGRMVPVDNMHITLVFLGSISKEKTTCILNKAGKLRVKPCTLVLDHLGWWKQAQVLWLAPATIPAVISSLVSDLGNCARQCEIRTDQRHYQPHVTLVRKVRQKPALPTIKAVRWPVRGFSLIVSETRPEGATYEETWSSS
jgi:RNA 2',3'-cyclic 3'-phosphodiesterase